MTSPQRFEQDLPVLLEGLYLAGTPDYRDDLVQRIAARRQRPAWTFPERWLPVDITTRRVAAPRVPWRAVGVLALIGLLMAATVAVYVGTQRRLPAPYGLAENGSIVYAADGDVFKREGPDGVVTPLITGPESETWAVHSPLGDRLAVLREADGGEELWVADADGSGLVKIGGPYRAGDWLDWSPDGRHIAVSYDRGGVNAIEIVPVDGSGGRRVATRMPAMNPTWRPPDGQQLLFRGQEGGRWGFYLIEVDGGEPVRLPIDGDRIEGGEYDLHAPAWSPSGDRLAYNSLVELPQSLAQTPGFRIFVADIAADGTVTDSRRFERDPTVDDELNAIFTPDGRSLVYQQRMGLTEDPPHPDTIDSLFIMSADGEGQPLHLGVDSRPGEGFNWAIAPDGTSLLVHRFAEDDDWLVDPVSGTAVQTDLHSDTGVSWQRKAP